MNGEIIAEKAIVKSVDNPADRDPIPETFNTIEEMAEFWETHDSADYEDCFGEEIEVEMDVPGSRREKARYFPIEAELAHKLEEVSSQKGLSAETLLNLWVQEKLTQVA